MVYKLKRGQTIGAIAAEQDGMLNDVFVDLGYLDLLLDTEAPQFLVLGRTGGGKTALMEMIKKRTENCGIIDPDELSMHYLQGSTILRTLLSLDIRLDIFFKFLWKHICIIELIRIRFQNESDIPARIANWFTMVSSTAQEKKLQHAAKKYAQNYASEYWEKSDTKIKKITNEMEEALKRDSSVDASLKKLIGGLKGSLGNSRSTRESSKIEQEVLNRAQEIVNSYQISDLSNLVMSLAKYGFQDDQKRYYLIIDDLDKDWMPDDDLYINLLRSLLYAVKDLNYRLEKVKIIVALRENLYHRIFQQSNQHDPQREKWADVVISLRWTKNELIQMVDGRLRHVFRGQYTTDAPTFKSILPTKQKRNGQDGADYVTDRTLRRPRDIIEFINLLISDQESFTRFTWQKVQEIEKQYSSNRLNALIDEWKDSYSGLACVFPFIRGAGSRFSFDHLKEDDLMDMFASADTVNCQWLKELGERYINGDLDISDVRLELLSALYLIGLIGVKEGHGQGASYSIDKAFDVTRQSADKISFVVNKTFWSALGLINK